MRARSVIPTGANPLNQSSHGIVTFVAFAIRAMASAFGASAVMNILLVIVLPARAVYSRYAPILRSVPSSGRDPYNTGMFEMIGQMMPPLRAVTDGVNGAI